MKKIKINSFKKILSISCLSLFLCISCAESNENAKNNFNKTDEIASKIKAPEIDMQLAILSNNIEAVKQHIKAGTDINKKDAMTGSTPLITAASFGKSEIAKILVDADADLSIKNNDGATALHTAAFFCRTDVVKILLEADADKTLTNNFGATPRETVVGDFKDLKPIYEMLKVQLEPMGMQIDLDYIEKTRPAIAEMLK